MYTLLLRSHWMTLPKAEHHAWWVGDVVGLIGKAPPNVQDFTKSALRIFLWSQVYWMAHC